MIAKLFVPSVRCPVCSHANDHDFRYCQRCGYVRKISSTHRLQQTMQIDLDGIDNRLQELFDFQHSTRYGKQKDSLQRELESFLTALPEHVTLATVTPRDIARFLIFKDRNGKTQVHNNGCQFLGKKGIFFVRMSH